MSQSVDARSPHPPPTVPRIGPPGALLIELIVYPGGIFKNHWALFVRSSTDSQKGIIYHATGNVRTGFEIQIRRNYDFSVTNRLPMNRYVLQWITQDFIAEDDMLNHGVHLLDSTAVCAFEESVLKVPAPTKSLRESSNQSPSQPRRIVQKNCQDWVVEVADQLVSDGIFGAEVARFLHAIKQ